MNQSSCNKRIGSFNFCMCRQNNVEGWCIFCFPQQSQFVLITSVQPTRMFAFCIYQWKMNSKQKMSLTPNNSKKIIMFSGFIHFIRIKILEMISTLSGLMHK